MRAALVPGALAVGVLVVAIAPELGRMADFGELRDLRPRRRRPGQPLQRDLAARGAGDLAFGGLPSRSGRRVRPGRRLLARWPGRPRGARLRPLVVARSPRARRPRAPSAPPRSSTSTAARGHALPGGEGDRHRRAARDADRGPRPARGDALPLPSCGVAAGRALAVPALAVAFCVPGGRMQCPGAGERAGGSNRMGRRT